LKVEEVSVEVSTIAPLGARMSEELRGLEEATMMTLSSLSINTLKTVGENVGVLWWRDVTRTE
jgi:hypothetical protein